MRLNTITKTAFVLLLTTCLCMVAGVDAASGQRKKVGLVLSGGGAKGVAHISAIKVIEEAGIPIDYIAGTSMGAIVGGLYAIGYDTETLDSLVRTQNWADLLSGRVSRNNLSFGAKENKEKYIFTLPFTFDKKLRLPTGLLGGYNVYNLLYELTIGYNDSTSFKQFPIPFSCVAFDMVSGRAVVLDHGILPEAIRASMSIPGAFQTVDMGDMVLVDGGIGNNFPVDVVRDMGAEIVIGIDVTAPLLEKDQIKSMTDIVEQLTSFTGQEAYEKNMKMVDLYVHPDITSFTAASFSEQAIDTLLVRGEKAMLERWDDLLALKEEIGVPRQFQPEEREQIDLERKISIRNIYFDGLKIQREQPLRKIIGITENSSIDLTQLSTAVAKLQGTNSLSDVHYTLDGPEPYDLTFVVREVSRNSISLGFHFDTEQMAALLLNFTVSGRNMTHSYFDITSRLSNSPYVKAAYIVGSETKPKINFSYTYRYNDLSLYRKGSKYTNLDFDHHETDVFFSNITARNFKMDVGVSYGYFHYRSYLTNREEKYSTESHGLVKYYWRTHLESLDSKYYPRKGVSFNTDISLNTTDFVTYDGYSPYAVIQADFMIPISVSKRVTFIPGAFGRVILSEDDHYAFASSNFMGGAVSGRYVPQQISFTGINNFERFGDAVLGARLDFRVRLWVKHYVSAKFNYAKSESEFFDVFTGRDIFGAGLNYSYNSLIGPIDLLFQWSNYDKQVGVYFNLGYYF